MNVMMIKDVMTYQYFYVQKNNDVKNNQNKTVSLLKNHLDISYCFMI